MAANSKFKIYSGWGLLAALSQKEYIQNAKRSQKPQVLSLSALRKQGNISVS